MGLTIHESAFSEGLSDGVDIFFPYGVPPPNAKKGTELVLRAEMARVPGSFLGTYQFFRTGLLETGLKGR